MGQACRTYDAVGEDFTDCHNDAITYYTRRRYHRQFVATRVVLWVAALAALVYVVLLY
jgi:hypothetical protein